MLEFCKDFSIFLLKKEPPFYIPEKQEKYQRKRRQVTSQNISPFGGQTQTQYISFDQDNKNDKGGIAEAVAEPHKSKAIVSKLNISFHQIKHECPSKNHFFYEIHYHKYSHLYF